MTTDNTPETTPTTSAVVDEPAATSTRERILDVALDRFSRQGYAGTSLREIAEDVGVSKAALYYHFRSKEDILLALHMRVHAVMNEAAAAMRGPMDDDAWTRLVEQLIGIAIRNRSLLALQLREQDALLALHASGAIEKHGDQGQGPEEQVAALLRDTSGDPETRIRRLAALGALVAALFGADALRGIADETIEGVLRKVATEVLRGRS